MVENIRERILVVEDDLGLQELLQEELESEGYQVDSAQSAEEAEKIIETCKPDLVVSDLRLPGKDGLSLIDNLIGMQPSPAILIITAFGTVQQAVRALKSGADDFITKPLEMDHFLLAVERLLEARRLREEVTRYRGLFAEKDFHGMLGKSGPMTNLFHQIRRIASADGPVLVLGESGTGKELVARAVHEESVRQGFPYLAVNCGGIPGELMESEFFGHVAGAFTSAQRSRAGLFQEASGGTLFLDEIGEMPLSLQAKLLRALQDGSVRPVGGDKEIHIDVRIIAASNRDLHGMVEENKFREDLYYRLETFAIEVPPLRQRGDDIQVLANNFLARFSNRKQRPAYGFSDEARECLMRYSYPGNVRELQNAVERAVTFCDSELVEVQHLPKRFTETTNALVSGTPHEHEHYNSEIGDHELVTLEAVQQKYISKVLQATDGNKRKAAEILGVTRRTLYRWLNQNEHGKQ